MIKMSTLRMLLEAHEVLASLKTMQVLAPRAGREADILATEKLTQKCIALLAAETPIDMDK